MSTLLNFLEANSTKNQEFSPKIFLIVFSSHKILLTNIYSQNLTKIYYRYLEYCVHPMKKELSKKIDQSNIEPKIGQLM